MCPPGGGDVAPARVGGEVEDVAVPAGGKHYRIGGVRLDGAGDEQRHAEGKNRARARPVEQAADQADPMRHPAFGRKGRRGIFRVGRPVAAGLADLDEAGSDDERGVSGEIRDRENLVAQRGDEQDVGLLEVAHLRVEAEHDATSQQNAASSAVAEAPSSRS